MELHYANTKKSGERQTEKALSRLFGERNRNFRRVFLWTWIFDDEFPKTRPFARKSISVLITTARFCFKCFWHRCVRCNLHTVQSAVWNFNDNRNFFSRCWQKQLSFTSKFVVVWTVVTATIDNCWLLRGSCQRYDCVIRINTPSMQNFVDSFHCRGAVHAWMSNRCVSRTFPDDVRSSVETESSCSLWLLVEKLKRNNFPLNSRYKS